MSVQGLDLAQGLGVMRPGMDVVDSLQFQVPLEAIRPLPGIKHKTPVGQHLLHLAVAVDGFLNQTDNLINGGLS